MQSSESFLQSIAANLFFTCTLFLLFSQNVTAFGAGNVPAEANLEDRAFRHGDISFALVGMVKILAGGAVARKLASQKAKKSKPVWSSFSFSEKMKRRFRRDPNLAEKRNVCFTEEDVALVYFGNYLRDMSQALDIGALKALGPGPITNFIGVASFLAFSRGSREFEVTEERLGCYRQEEHIDNPFGYPDGEPEGSDPRKLAEYNGLRGPVREVETEIDPDTGMKRYIADESGDWDTSSRFFKNSIIRAIELGREGLVNSKKKEWEALRQLGQALHVLEDFPAHSNFIELALNKLGYKDVFCCVGAEARIKAPNDEMVPPLVTGTFGGADAVHSMLGELLDSLNQKGVTDASKKIRESGGKNVDKMRPVFEKMIGNKDDKDEKTDDGDDDEEDADPGLFTKLDDYREKVVDMDGKQMHAILVGLYTLHDKIARGIAGKARLENEAGPISTFVFATIEPVIAPLILKCEEALLAASQAVVEGHDLNSDFADPKFENPSHSVLAKDHFANILNGPAGKLAETVFKQVVEIVSEAWNNDDIDPKEAAERACLFMHHPYFADENNPIQKSMIDYVEGWIGRQGNEKDEVLSRLTRDGVINLKNTTQGLKNNSTIRVEPKAHKTPRVASLGLWGIIGLGFKKIFPFCFSKDDSDDKGDYNSLNNNVSAQTTRQ